MPGDHADAPVGQSQDLQTSTELAPGAEQDADGEQDVRERPVRERLEKTSITTAPSELAKPLAMGDASSEEDAALTDPHNSDDNSAPSDPTLRGRRKRSFDEFNPESPQDAILATNATSKHIRKRSRDERNPNTQNEVAKDENHPVGDAHVSDKVATTQEQYLSEASLVAKSSTRSTTPSADSTNMSSSKIEEATSPRNKRNRDQFTGDHDPSIETSKSKNLDPTAQAKSQPRDEASSNQNTQLSPAKSVTDEPETKRPRDESLTRIGHSESSTSSKLPPSSAFANTSTESPFGALAPPKSPPQSPPQTSSSAFASSGFASFASSTQSPFGAVSVNDKSTASTDKDKASITEETKNDNLAPSGFGALTGSTKSPFATAGAPSSAFGSQSGFGKLSNGFGSFGSGDKALQPPLSSFASPGTSGIVGLGSKPTKPIGALADEDEDEDGDATGEEESENNQTMIAAADNTPQDTRFFVQELETGEEDEETLFTSRAKLYISHDKQWKERGVGTFKVNTSTKRKQEANDEDASEKKTARFIMRAEGSHRVVLNSPIKQEIKIEDPAGGPPRGKTAIFLGFVDEKPTMMLLKMRSNVQAEELHSVIADLQNSL